MTKLIKTRHAAWLFLSLLVITWFADIQYRDLTHTDEGRYAEIPREMVITGDWLTPRLNEFKYFEKPPLHYWITATAYSVFGIEVWTARLWTELSGLLTLLLTIYLAWRLYGTRAAWFAGLIMASNIYFYLIGHINVLDTGLSFFMALTLAGFLLAQKEPERYRRWMLLAWAAAAAALLTKGLIAIVLPGAVFVLYSLLKRDLKIWTQLYFFPGLLLFLLISAPWFVMVSLANPEFPEFFFIHEHFQRFTSKIHQRYEPWWYFIAFMIMAVLPWLGQIPGMVKDSLKNFSAPAEQFDERLFLLLWVVVIVGFFSLSSSKLPHYIMPVMPAVALLLAAYFSRLHRVPLLKLSAGLTLLTAVAGFIIVSIDHPKLIRYEPWLPSMQAGFILLAVFAELAIILKKQPDIVRAGLISVGWYLMVLIILAGAQSVSGQRSAWPLLKDTIHEITEDTPVYSVGYYQQTVPFYLGRTVRLVEYKGELEFGITQEPEKHIPDMETFGKLWMAEDRAFAIMKIETWEPLAEQGLPMRERARDHKFILVERP
jgi:4-amino-4-deoxy-L-arabinose transferase-like glycosyltransferase